MYQKVKDYADKNGLKLDESQSIVYGHIQGYFVVIRQDTAKDAQHTVQLWVKAGNMEPLPGIAEYVQQCCDKYQYLQRASYDGSKITAEFQGVGFKGSQYVLCLDAFLKDIIGYAGSNQLVMCCEHCGGEEELDLYQLEDMDHVLCGNCYADMADEIVRLGKEKKESAKNGNVPAGILGAILGALIGAAVWVLIYRFGYISALGGGLIVILALEGYKLLGGRLNRIGIFICCMISALMLLGAGYFSLAFAIMSSRHHSVHHHISLLYALRSVPAYFAYSDVQINVIRDLVLSYVFMIWGAWRSVKDTYTENNVQTRNRKVAHVSEQQISR